MRLLAIILAATAGGLIPTAGSASPPAREEDPPRCAAAMTSTVVIDDLASAPGWLSDQVRRFRIPAPAESLRGALQPTGCFTVLEADPVFAGMPDTVQPDLVLRARIAQLRAAEKSVGEKATTAVERYISSYIGAFDEDVPVLGVVEVSVQAICARTRRIVAEATGRGATIVIAVDVIYPPEDAFVHSAPGVILQAMTISANRLKKVEASAADLVITPRLRRTSTQFSIRDREWLVAAGEEAAREALPAIRRLYQSSR